MSLYQLTIEPGTRFATLVREGKFTPLDDDAAADLFALTRERMTAAGLPAYEISNHARPGEESRHNLTYWRYGDYAGIGPGAHGRRLKPRRCDTASPKTICARWPSKAMAWWNSARWARPNRPAKRC
jgi:coproporphyrinogen III oxidase-like Fe-S oxidoreductase